MALEFMDKISAFIPSIEGPAAPLSLREKMRWTGICLAVFFILYSTYVIGVNQQAVTSSIYQLISIISAAKIGSVITVGISPIVLSSILLQLFSGSGLFKIDQQNPIEKARFQALQKLFAIVLAFVEAIIYVLTGFVPVSSPAAIPIVIIQLAAGAIMVLFLDEIMTKYGVTSGINIFIAAGVSYSIIAGIFTVILPEAGSAISAGGAAALSNAVLAFGPLLFSAIIFVVSIYAYEMKVEIPLAFGQFRGVGGRLPIPFLYVSVLPVILASSLEAAFIVWFRFIANVGGALAGIGKIHSLLPACERGAAAQRRDNLSHITTVPLTIHDRRLWAVFLVSRLSTRPISYLPWGGAVLVPEWAHIVHIHDCLRLPGSGLRQVLGRDDGPEPEGDGRAAGGDGMADTWIQARPEDSGERAEQVHPDHNCTGQHLRRAPCRARDTYRRARIWNGNPANSGNNLHALPAAAAGEAIRHLPDTEQHREVRPPFSICP